VQEAIMSVSPQAHWETVYTQKDEQEVSWFQESPEPSLELIARTAATPASTIIDIGGGASRLVDALLVRGFNHLSVLDLSEAALAKARARLGENAAKVRWIAADVTTWRPDACYDIWHDRAAFHFLTESEAQRAYVERLRLALRAGGHAIIATFALDGPQKCSGLPVARHSAETIGAVLGTEFALVDTRRHEHLTPWGSVQKFQFSTFVRKDEANLLPGPNFDETAWFARLDELGARLSARRHRRPSAGRAGPTHVLRRVLRVSQSWHQPLPDGQNAHVSPAQIARRAILPQRAHSDFQNPT
jgi:SAM-dependent methyltransferase